MSMKQARPKEADYHSVIDFLTELETIIEHGEHPETGEDMTEAEDIADWLNEHWPSVSICWRRVVFGGQVAIQNACDPNESALEWRKELKEAAKAAGLDNE